MFTIIYQVGESGVWKTAPGVFTERWQADLRAGEIARNFDVEYGAGFAEVKVADIPLNA